ncbi:MAG TPA: subclass B3 metallo-beta-lactamase [Acidobacteriaceae bacterium]|nr:subclass B3 metallo-beta-lactamase [Acidobacteriaceae bacterium]
MTFRCKTLRCAALVMVLACGFSLRAQIDPSWTAPQKPFRIAGNLYYVGSRDLAAYLITTSAGNILINANLKSSPPQIRASVEALGFRWADTRILLNSQAHFDHAAGNAEVIRETGAKLMVMDGDVHAMETGDVHDFGGSDLTPYPPARVARVLHDGDTVRLGGVVLTAHKTAGHTRGCTAWTMQVEDQGHLRNVVIVGGFAPLSSYRLIATPGRPASYPEIAEDFLHGFAVERTLPCDIFLGAHGQYFGLQDKLARLPKEGNSVWIDPQGYQQTIADAQKIIEERIAAERRETTGTQPAH